MSSPDTHDLREVITRYPRGIINPNYPGFQHLAHTLSEHFIDHHQQHQRQQHHHHHHHFEQQLSDSELSDEVEFDVLAYRSENLVNVNIMSDSNNNDNINNNADGLGVVLVEERVIDLNRNKNRQIASSMQLTEHVANDYDMKADDGNVNNLLMKSEPKVFCESKQLEHLVIEERPNEFSTDDEDEECFNLSQVEPQQMDFDEDDEDMADLSGEDDAAIKNELERIDSADNDFNENINCDLVTYLQQYDFKMDLQKSFQQLDDEKIDDECLTDEDNCKLPTPDILIEHNASSNNVGNKKLQNDDMEDVINISLPPNELQLEGSVCDEDKEQQKTMPQTPAADVSQDEVRDYQPDLIKSIGDNNHGRITGIQQRGDNEISPHAKHEISNNKNVVVVVDGGSADNCDGGENEEKIINQVQTEMTVASGTTQLSFDSASSTVDIIGDFGKEIEKEIGLIVSGYLNGEKLSPSLQTNEPIRPLPVTATNNKKSSEEIVFDENKFIEHLKYFSKVSSAGKIYLFFYSSH